MTNAWLWKETTVWYFTWHATVVYGETSFKTVSNSWVSIATTDYITVSGTKKLKGFTIVFHCTTNYLICSSFLFKMLELCWKFKSKKYSYWDHFQNWLFIWTLNWTLFTIRNFSKHFTLFKIKASPLWFTSPQSMVPNPILQRSGTLDATISLCMISQWEK